MSHMVCDPTMIYSTRRSKLVISYERGSIEVLKFVASGQSGMGEALTLDGTLNSIDGDLIAKGLSGKVLVLHLRLLQAEDVRRLVPQPVQEKPQAGSHRVGVESGHLQYVVGGVRRRLR